MTPPKGVTYWKMKFFYVKACAVYANMTFRDVNIGVTDEDIPVATAKTVDWFSRLQHIELKKLDNNQLWVLRMMLTRPDRKARPVLREKSGVDAVGLWRMFEPDFKGQVDLIPVELREGFNIEIVGNFRVPKRDVLRAPVPEGEKAILADLGKFEKRIPKKHVEKKQVKKTTRGRGKGRAEGSDAPSLVSQAAGSGAAAGGTAASPPVVGDKREPEQKAAGGGEPKRRKLQSKRAAPAQKKHAVAAESQDAGFSFFDFPSSPTHTAAADAGVPKEPVVPKEPAAPFVRDPTVQVEKTVEKTASQIFDTVDSYDNLISPNEGDGLDLRFSDAGKQKSDAEVRQHGVEPQKPSAGEKVTSSTSGGAGYDGPPIQPEESELEYYYRTYTQDRSTAYHRPHWTVMQVDDISNDPSVYKEILGGLGTPFETERARAAPRELRINQLSTMLVGSSIVANVILEDYRVLGRREEETARLRAEAEELKQTSEWAATAQLKQVRTLAKLLSDERKSWNEKFSNDRKKWNDSWAKQNDTLFRARQELTNAKAANAALIKEKAAAEAVAVKAQQVEAWAVKALGEAKEAGARAAKALEEAKERERRSSKAFEEANAERTRLDKVVASLQIREVAVTDLTGRATVAEERANAAVEARDALTSSFQQLEADREWMRSQGIAYIVQAIMDAPETATGLDLVKKRARDAVIKAGYSRCVSYMNVMSEGGFTAE
ncbi:hypothetical protein HanIR_Chr11g0513671 [Helianthus annuus]|nr:hypothetical protein HanIR_Chr11g0513671 [Helianthus annuus]